MSSIYNSSESETVSEKRKLPRKKVQSKDRILENKLLQARKNENILMQKPRKKIVLPKIPIETQSLDFRNDISPPLFFPSLHVSTKTKKLDAITPARIDKDKPKYLLKQVERIQLPETPKETAYLRKCKVKRDEKHSAFFQPAIDRNSYHHHDLFLAQSERFQIARQRRKRHDEYTTVRRRVIDEMSSLDGDIKQFIDGIRQDIKKSSNDIMKEMEQQRSKTRKQIAELRKVFSHDNKTALSRFS